MFFLWEEGGESKHFDERIFECLFVGSESTDSGIAFWNVFDAHLLRLPPPVRDLIL